MLVVLPPHLVCTSPEPVSHASFEIHSATSAGLNASRGLIAPADEINQQLSPRGKHAPAFQRCRTT